MSTLSLTFDQLTDRDRAFTSQFFNEPFPIKEKIPGEACDSVLSAFLGSKNVRHESCNPTEAEIGSMREVIASAIAQGRPVPVLVAWGPKKPFNNISVDVSEICALKTLEAVHRRVSLYHEPGIALRLRIDDLSTKHLFALQEGSASAIDLYASRFKSLIRLLGMAFIEPVFESDLVEQERFTATADGLMSLFLKYVSDTDRDLSGYEKLSSWQALADHGWKGEIPFEQRYYFRKLYAKAYGAEKATQDQTLARYLAGTLARHRLSATAKPEGKFMQISFMPNVPGAPAHFSSNRLVYRTLPRNCGHMNFVPWRGLGYLKFNEHHAAPKLISAHDSLVEKLNASRIQVGTQEDFVPIRLLWQRTEE